VFQQFLKWFSIRTAWKIYWFTVIVPYFFMFKGWFLYLPLWWQWYLQRVSGSGHLPLRLRGSRDPSPRADPAPLHHQPGPPRLRQSQQLLDCLLLHSQPSRRTQWSEKRKIVFDLQYRYQYYSAVCGSETRCFFTPGIRIREVTLIRIPDPARFFYAITGILQFLLKPI
jgi:hypothetical protein